MCPPGSVVDQHSTDLQLGLDVLYALLLSSQGHSSVVGGGLLHLKPLIQWMELDDDFPEYLGVAKINEESECVMNSCS
jgi:hypothetical protein